MGKIKEREKKEKWLIVTYSLVGLFDLFESFIRLNYQFRDTFKSFQSIKGIVHPKIKVLTLFTPPYVNETEAVKLQNDKIISYFSKDALN